VPESTPSEIDIRKAFKALSLLPVAADAFAAESPSIEEVIGSAIVVLDTNTLLLPYGAGAESLEQITSVYKQLKCESRIYLPAQVAREFIKNRPLKICELYKGLSDKISKLSLCEALRYPILEGVEEYGRLNDLISSLKQAKKEINSASELLRQRIAKWETNDPVNSAYRLIFTPEIITEPVFDQKQVLSDFLKRQELLVPPGYKDSSKDDFGIGDYLIWLTILELGSAHQCDIIFVSGEEKPDWQHRSDSSGLFPRYELLEEYRRKSSGKSFYMCKLSSLLELLIPESTSVNEIKSEENRIQESNHSLVACPFCGADVGCQLQEQIGASAKPHCPSCGSMFHAHRTKAGIVTNKPNTRTISIQTEVVECPNCFSAVKAELNLEPGSTLWCRCTDCEANFPVHRLNDGFIKAGRISSRSSQVALDFSES
jgi:hypothetical protein